VEGGKGFLLEGGLHKRNIDIKGIGEKVTLTGTYEVLNGIKSGDILIMLDRNK